MNSIVLWMYRKLITFKVVILLMCVTLPFYTPIDATFAKDDQPKVIEAHTHHIKQFEKYIKSNYQNKSAKSSKSKYKHKHKSKSRPKHRWVSLGDCRVTTYCPSCNDPAGYQSSSGRRLTEGMVACNWLRNGTKIRIGKKQVYTVMDYCGTEAIDIFVDTDICYCNTNKYAEVEIWR